MPAGAVQDSLIEFAGTVPSSDVFSAESAVGGPGGPEEVAERVEDAGPNEEFASENAFRALTLTYLSEFGVIPVSVVDRVAAETFTHVSQSMLLDDISIVYPVIAVGTAAGAVHVAISVPAAVVPTFVSEENVGAVVGLPFTKTEFELPELALSPIALTALT